MRVVKRWLHIKSVCCPVAWLFSPLTVIMDFKYNIIILEIVKNINRFILCDSCSHNYKDKRRPDVERLQIGILRMHTNDRVPYYPAMVVTRNLQKVRLIK